MIGFLSDALAGLLWVIKWGASPAILLAIAVRIFGYESVAQCLVVLLFICAAVALLALLGVAVRS